MIQVSQWALGYNPALKNLKTFGCRTCPLKPELVTNKGHVIINLQGWPEKSESQSGLKGDVPIFSKVVNFFSVQNPFNSQCCFSVSIYWWKRRKNSVHRLSGPKISYERENCCYLLHAEIAVSCALQPGLVIETIITLHISQHSTHVTVTWTYNNNTTFTQQ